MCVGRANDQPRRALKPNLSVYTVILHVWLDVITQIFNSKYIIDAFTTHIMYLTYTRENIFIYRKLSI